MNDAEKIDRVVKALSTVPEKKLLIIELVNRIPIKYGDLDPTVLSQMQPQIHLAITEAKAYGAHTIQAVDVLVKSEGEGRGVAMWDLDQLVRQNNDAALEGMMRGRQTETTQHPQPEAWSLAILSDKLLVGPPAIVQIMECLQHKDTTEAFFDLIHEFLPGQEKKVMSEPRHRRVYRFCYLFKKKYYPLPANTDCPVSNWIAGIPVELLAMSYHTYHELQMRPGYLLLLSLVVYPYEGDERDTEDDSVPFNPAIDFSSRKYKPRASDIAWLKDMVNNLAVDGQWIAPMGFVVVKKAANAIELRQAADTPEVKEVVARTLLIAEKAGITATFPKNGHTAEEKMNGARIPLIEKVKDIVGAELATRIPAAGWQPEVLRRMTDKTKYEGLGDFVDWACSQTGCVMLDTASENCKWAEGMGEPIFKWTKNNVNTLTEQWPKVQRIRDKIDHIVEWVEASPSNRFGELLDFLLHSKFAKLKEKKRPAYEPFDHYCPLDMEGDEEDEDHDKGDQGQPIEDDEEAVLV